MPNGASAEIESRWSIGHVVLSITVMGGLPLRKLLLSYKKEVFGQFGLLMKLS